MEPLCEEVPGVGCCPCCLSGSIKVHRRIDGYTYFHCLGCALLFIDPKVLDEIDAGLNVRKYDKAYWEMELSAAKERANGVALARMAEVIMYSEIPVHRFVDIGSGPGYFLDAIARHLPTNSHRFYGIEKFPPPETERSKHPNYRVGEITDLPGMFDAGLCMEVVEHLTPKMMRSLLERIVQKSTPGACYIVNTGLSEFVLNVRPEYLDPVRRGHIVGWSIAAVRALCVGLSLNVHEIDGKPWAFVLEIQRSGNTAVANLDEDIRHRSSRALPENKALLSDPQMGSVLLLIGQYTGAAFGSPYSM